ncbi:MAG: nucleoside triphosphate pyrophosphohydrolase [Coriobacteriia bacterium]|nr:nucleoside triphosphate pyrophosphohydrolase [Coriobacteriia bacterium]
MSPVNNQNGADDPGAIFAEFVDTIAVLRAPGGCPWDAKQTHISIAPNMLEEAYEAVDAIEKKTPDALKEELGDVLLQVVLQARIAADEQEFDISDVIESVQEKIIRRHPHVFGDGTSEIAHGMDGIGEINNEEDVAVLWAAIKRGEKASADVPAGLFDDVAFSLSALKLAADISKKAVHAGFEWPTVGGVIDKIDEEIVEFCETEPGTDEASEELGDILFTVVNLARKYAIDPEMALRSTCRKFIERWQHMERFAAQENKTLDECPVEEQEKFWQQAKIHLGNKGQEERRA